MNEFEKVQCMYLPEKQGIQVSETVATFLGLWAFITMMLGIGAQFYFAARLLERVVSWLA